MKHGLIDHASLQHMLYEALDESDDIVLVLEQTGESADDLIIVSANESYCRASGYTHAEVIGRTLHGLSAAEPSACAEIEQAAHERRSCRLELLCKRKSGEPFWFGLHMMPVRDGLPRRFILLGRDITESLHARQQQAAIQSLLAKVFLVVRAPVAIASDTGLIQMTNPALDELLGYPAGGLVGKNAFELTSPSGRAAVVAARQRQAEDGLDYTVRTSLLRADGGEVAVEVTSITVQRDDLRRFRIATVLKLPEQNAGTTVHIAGKIRLIGLQEVKAALGPRWAALAVRAMASAEHVIRQRCGPRDTFSRTPDGAFLICFADTSEEEAGFRAAALAREIRARLIGEGESEAAADVSAIAATVEIPSTPGQSADDIANAISERLNNRLAQIEARARETLREAVNIASCRLEPVHSRRSHDVVAQFAKLPRALEQRILVAYSTLSAKERQGFDFDRLVLGVAADQAITEIADGGSLLVLVNVDCEVFLDRRHTERYVTACQTLDVRLRERLVLVLSGIPKGFPKSRITECMMRLRPFCHAVGVQSDGLDAPSTELSLFGATIVVLQVDTSALDDAQYREKLARQIDNLHAHQARILVRHIASWDAARPLIRLGVDLISVTSDETDVERIP